MKENEIHRKDYGRSRKYRIYKESIHAKYRMRRYRAITRHGLAARSQLDATTYRKVDNTNRPIRKKRNKYTI